MIPTGRNGSAICYRFHPLIKLALQAALHRNEPHLVTALHQRAGEWFEAAGNFDAEIRHLIRSGDMVHVGVLVWAHVHPGLSNEGLDQLRGWLGGLPAECVGESMHLMVSAAWLALLAGDPASVVRWQVMAEMQRTACSPTDHVDLAEIDVALAQLRNWRDPGMNGPAPSTSCAASFDNLPAGSRWRPAAEFLAGLARALDGDNRRAEDRLRAAAELSRVMDQPAVQADCLAALALLFYNGEYSDESLVLAEAAEQLMVDNHLQEDRPPNVRLTLRRCDQVTMLRAVAEIAAGTGEIENIRSGPPDSEPNDT